MMTNVGGDDGWGVDVDDLSRAFPPGAEPPFRTPVGLLVATAVRRGRRRRIATLSAKVVLFALSVIAAVVMIANLSPGAATEAVSPASSPSVAPSSPVATAVTPLSRRLGLASPVAVCTAAQLSGKVSREGVQSSNVFVAIVLTNAGPGSCTLSGYPKLTAWGPTGQRPSAPLETVLTRSSTYQIPDPGSTTVDIPPGRSAWFAIGTGVGYGSPVVVFDRVAVDIGPVAGGKVGRVNVALSMSANAPLGKAIPVTVTAFAPGNPPKP
jgi:hypothetical protein